MKRSERVYEKHQPERELTERWPEWSVFDTPDLDPMGERFHFELRAILMNSDGDREWMSAHVLAHLDLGHHLAVGEITEAEESDANMLVLIRLDLFDFDAASTTVDEWDDVPVDGEPTVHLR
jgi:hypothetical protein